ncbi:hypothetical protein AX16_001607 [Volvariella volvacea WC 439]|nr:hypothetical protein AX16_001607 [Volvariella volvacea WC 439]
MSSISTKLTELLSMHYELLSAIVVSHLTIADVKTPIVSAPMGTVTTPQMAVAVTSAGGFGMLGAALDTPEQLKKDLQLIRTSLNIPVGQPLPVGVGFIGAVLDKLEKSNEPRLPTVLAELPSVIWLAFGNDLWPHIKAIRDYDAQRTHRTKVFVMVNSVEEAVKAANEWKVDAIVAQGHEAGGHGAENGPPLRILIQAIKRALPNGPPVLAAGGISSGADIAGHLILGADGIVVGTRLLCTPESQYSDQAKELLIKAGHNATEKSRAFDDAARLNFWPAHVDGRAISNKIITDYRQGLSLEERIKNYDAGLQSGEIDRLIVWAGTGTGFLTRIENAKDIIKELHEGAVEALENASRFVTK